MAGAPAGYDVFLSYSRTDQDAANQIRDRLVEDGKLKVFIDWRALLAGRPWQPALETALADCRAMVVLIGSAGIGGWQHREIQLGLDRQTGAEKTATPFPVIPVLLPGLEQDDYPLGTFLALNTWVTFEQNVNEPGPLQRLLAAVRGQPLDGLRDFTSLRPYRGLLAFREQDAGLFFGRERFVDELVAKVRQRSATNVVAVLGRSGSGKSSVVFAGLLPELRRERGDGQQAVWNIAALRPGKQPLQALIETFDPPDPALGEIEILVALTERADLLRQRKATLAQLVERRIAKDPGSTRQLLYVDQWEELYTQAQAREANTDEDKARAADARLLIDLVLDAAAKGPCTLVLSVRSDFYPDIQTHDRLRAAVQDRQVSLGPMTAAELTAAIEGPARAIGGSVDGELTKRLLRDIGLDLSGAGSDHYDIGKLPLLEYALEQAWSKAEHRRIGLAHYRGLEQALEERANQVYDRLAPEQQVAAKSLFVSLVTPGEGREDTRARITLGPNSDLADAAEAFAGRDVRLVVTGDDAGGRVVEVSHEALIRHWERLRAWIDENRASLRTRADLAADRAEWLKHGQRADLLIPPGLRLEAARKLRNEPGDVRINDILDYIQTSIDADISAQNAVETARAAQHQRELEAARQIADQQRRRADAEFGRVKLLHWSLTLAGIAAIVMACFVSFGLYIYTIMKPSADETTAALIWSRLDFEEIDDPRNSDTVRALWDLAGATRQVQDAFLYQLAQNRVHVGTLVSSPTSIRRAFGLRQNDEYNRRLIRPILDAIPKTTDPDQLQALAQAAQTLGPTPDQTQAALGPILDGIRRTKSSSSLEALARAVQALGPTPGQAQAALDPVLDAIRRSGNPYALKHLARAVQILGPNLEPWAAQAALGLVLDAIPITADPVLLQAKARVVQILGPNLTPEQAQAALGLVFDAIPTNADLVRLQALAQAIERNAADERSKTGIEAARAELAITVSPSVAAIFAREIAETLPLDPAKPRPYVTSIVELLKWPTTAGLATDALLEVLHERVPSAPGKEAGLDATVAWVAATYPDIDLDGPPTYPASGGTGGAR